MEILVNLLPTCLAHSISYRVMNWAGFSINIPVVIDIGLNMKSHIDDNPKVYKNLRWSNWFPGMLVIGVMESDILSS